VEAIEQLIFQGGETLLHRLGQFYAIAQRGHSHLLLGHIVREIGTVEHLLFDPSAFLGTETIQGVHGGEFRETGGVFRSSV
jgi:hypothetical protein